MSPNGRLRGKPAPDQFAFLRHELCQPLTYLSTSLGIIRKRLEEDQTSVENIQSAALRALAAAQEAVSHMAQIVQRIGVEETLDEVGPVDLAELVLSTLLMVEEEIGARAELVRDIECRPTVLGNRTRLCQVLLNLLTNAVFAVQDRGEGRGTITVRVSVESDSVATLVVCDDGVGISAGDRARVGNPNFTTRPGRGLGLGLALSRSIVESYDGSLLVESEAGVGTTVRATLRLVPP